jgi:hypothetical protein
MAARHAPARTVEDATTTQEDPVIGDTPSGEIPPACTIEAVTAALAAIAAAASPLTGAVSLLTGLSADELADLGGVRG